MFPDNEKLANTVLVGTNAEIKVRVTDEDDNPVANKDVQLAQKLVYPSSSDTYYWFARDIENLTDTVKRTDANGCVTFVFGLKNSKDSIGNIDSRSSRYVSSFKLTASIVGNSDVEKQTTDVKFGAITFSGMGISVQNETDPYKEKKLKIGENKDLSNNALTAAHQKIQTHDANGESVVYVGSQQVSTKESEDHAVYFKLGSGAFGITVPGSEADEVQDAGVIKEDYNWSTGEYLTYTEYSDETKHWGATVDKVNAAELQYATVNFSKLSLSKYSRFRVRAYLKPQKDSPTNQWVPITLTDPGADVSGQKISGDFSVQIPISKGSSGYLYVESYIQSKGQVNDDVNDGYTVKSVVGVKRNTSTSSGVTCATEELPGLDIVWSKDDEAGYELESDLEKLANKTSGTPGTNLRDLVTRLKTANPGADHVTYKFAAFPRTGNAILTVYNSADKPIAYYALPTENELYTNNAGNTELYENGNRVYKNVNILSSNIEPYLISANEALNNVGDVKTEKGYAVVNSCDTGVTHVKGTITSSNPNIKIDATNDTVYTSVNWNPLPVSGPTTPGGRDAELGAALVGQQITLSAQLADKNGNPVSVKGVGVKFWQDNDNDKNNTGATEIKKGITKTLAGGASVVEVEDTTDPYGCAKLTLVAGKPMQAIGIYATVDGNTYNLKYTLGKGTPGEKEIKPEQYVDLYWVDANIYFEPDANVKRDISTTYNEPSKETAAKTVDGSQNGDIDPTVGNHWIYEVRTNGDISQAAMGSALAGKLENYNKVDISGLAVQTSKRSDSVGDVSDITATKLGSTAKVTSTKAGCTYLVNVLNSASVEKDKVVEFTFTKNDTAPISVKNVGTGVTTLDKKLTLNIQWHASAPNVNIFIPTGKKADKDVYDVPVYVLVQDEHGNPLNGKSVTLEDKSGKGDIDHTSTSRAVKITDPKGIATFVVSRGSLNSGESSELVADVDTISGVYTSSIKWIDTTSLYEGFSVEKVDYNYDAKTISLTFTNDIYAPSGELITELFTVKYGEKEDGTGTPVQQIVTSAKVSGKTVILSVPALTTPNADDLFEVTIDIAGATKKDDTSIIYKFVSVDGQFLDATTNAVKFKAMDTRPIPPQP